MLSGIASASSAGASACAGGVCAVAAQAGSAWAAGSAGVAVIAGSAAGGANAGGNALANQMASNQWLAPTSVTPPAMPWWAMLAMIVLWLSTVWTIMRLKGMPRAAWLAAMGSILITVADLHWIASGMDVEYTLLASGMVLLLLAPAMPLWSPSDRMDHAIRAGLVILPLLAIIFAFWLQVVKGWAPCPLCWLERAELMAIALTAMWNKPGLAITFATLGTASVLAQMIEAGNDGGQPAHLLTLACSNIGPSCATAGNKVLWNFPITWWTGGLMIALFFMGMLYNRRFLLV